MKTITIIDAPYGKRNPMRVSYVFEVVDLTRETNQLSIISVNGKRVPMQSVPNRVYRSAVKAAG